MAIPTLGRHDTHVTVSHRASWFKKRGCLDCTSSHATIKDHKRIENITSCCTAIFIHLPQAPPVKNKIMTRSFFLISAGMLPESDVMQCNATVHPCYANRENAIPKTSLTTPLPITKIRPILLLLTWAILTLLLLTTRLHRERPMLLLKRRRRRLLLLIR